MGHVISKLKYIFIADKIEWFIFFISRIDKLYITPCGLGEPPLLLLLFQFASKDEGFIVI